jgi:hypothetical protein
MTLPQGMTEFNDFAEKMIEAAGLPNNDSTKFAVAAAIVNMPEPKPEVSEDYFVQILKRGAARQVAGQVMWDLKEKQKAAIAAEQAKKVEATTPEGTVASDAEKTA